MANGLFSRNATVMGPEQAMANVGRSLGRGFGEPLLGMMGRQSEEQAVMNVMKEVDTSNLDSVVQGFQAIMEINPAAAAEFRTQVMPLVTAQQTQLGKEADLINAEAKLTKAMNEGAPKPKDQYNAIVQEYKTTFCQGGPIGKECTIPMERKDLLARFPNRVPSLKEWFEDKGTNRANLYKAFAGNTDTQGFATQKTGDYGDIGAQFNLANPNDKELIGKIKRDLDNGVPESQVIAKLNQLNAIKKPEPQKSKTSTATDYYSLIEELKGDIIPLVPDFLLPKGQEMKQDKRDAVREFVIDNEELIRNNPELIKEISKDPEAFYDTYKEQYKLPDITLNRTIEQELLQA